MEALKQREGFLGRVSASLLFLLLLDPFRLLVKLILSFFCRLDYQARPSIRGVSSFNHLIFRLPPRAHSIYYRDEIGNISTSHLWGDSRKVISHSKEPPCMRVIVRLD